MEKFVVITYLFDFYQALLTDKQRNLLKGYYFEDFSLGELSEQYQISRQSIFDTIKKTELKLLDLENKLSLFSKYQEDQQTLLSIKHLCDQVKKTSDKCTLHHIQEMSMLVDGLINKT